MIKWRRIPVDIDSETDRRTLAGLLVAYGLETRIVKIRETNRGTPKRYIEYRDTGCGVTKTPTPNVKISGESL